MADKESHSIRNSIIASVIAGVILMIVPTLRSFITGAFAWVWSVLKSLVEALLASYSVQGWLLCVLGLLALIGIILIFKSMPILKPEHCSYVEDFLYEIRWRWDWANNVISDLWCFCPTCDATLIYDDSSCRNHLIEANQTDFICERCKKVVSTIHGGNLNYATSAVEREIDRRVRTGEYRRGNDER